MKWESHSCVSVARLGIFQTRPGFPRKGKEVLIHIFELAMQLAGACRKKVKAI